LHLVGEFRLAGEDVPSKERPRTLYMPSGKAFSGSAFENSEAGGSRDSKKIPAMVWSLS
jgi:hypothetical protein